MRKYIRPAICLATIGVFLIMAMASFGPDASSNTTVAIKRCEEKPPVSLTLSISVTLKEEGSFPAIGEKGKLFISHQKVTNSEECIYAVESQEVIDFTTDASGSFHYTGSTWTHDNSEDLIRVELNVEGGILYGHDGVKEVKVEKYGSGTFYFYNNLWPYL